MSHTETTLNIDKNGLFRVLLSPYRQEDALLLWLLVGLIYSLPLPFVIFLLLGVLLYPWLPPLWRAQQRSIIGVGLISGIITGYLSLPSWLSGESLLAGVTLVAVLKRAELHSSRDRLVLIVAVFVSNSLNLVYWNNLPALLHLFGLIFLLFGLLWHLPASGNSVSNRLAAVNIVCWSLPLALIFFLLLPRIPGPLWDTGLAFGMPISVYQKTSSLITPPASPGNETLVTLRNQQQVVLVAEFSGAMPLKSQLYWRGSVSYGYENGDWVDSLAGTTRSRRLAGAYRNMDQYQSLITSHRPAVSYRVKVAPHGKFSLFAPDLPRKNVQESFISADGQLLAIRPLHQEFSYRGESFLDASFKPTKQPTINLSDLPEPERRPIEATASDWDAQFTDAINADTTKDDTEKSIAREKFIQEALLNFLTSPPDWFSVRPPFSADRLQNWVGNIMLILQRAGLPARMVSGYRGGDLIALSDVIVVREKHRHHWLEFWNAERGWQRLEIKDILQIGQPASEIKQQQSPRTDQAEVNKTTTPTQSDKKKSQIKQGEAINSWWSLVEEWLQRYTPETLISQEVSTSDSGQSINASLWLPLLCLLWVTLFLIVRRYQQRPETMELAWRSLLRNLAAQGFPLQPWECPSRLLSLLQEQKPLWEKAGSHLIQTYLAHRFSSEGAGLTSKTYTAQVKRFTQALKGAPSNYSAPFTSGLPTPNSSTTEPHKKP